MPTNKKHIAVTIPAKYGEPKFDPTYMSYLVYGLEKAPTTGYEHYQTYVELNEEMAYSDVYKLFGGPCDISIRRRDKKTMIAYCKKDGKWREFGAQMKQGERTDIKDMMKDVKSGEKIVSIAEKYESTWTRNYRAMEYYKSLLLAKNKLRKDVSITAIVGPPGTGKTTLASLMVDLDDTYFKTLEGHWYDGYDGEKTIIFDEFRKGSVDLKHLLQLVSPIPFLLPVKGKSVKCQAVNIIIISNYTMDKWYDLDEVSTKALSRRIKNYFEVSEVGVASLLPTPPPPVLSKDTLRFKLGQSRSVLWTQDEFFISQSVLDEKNDDNCDIQKKEEK